MSQSSRGSSDPLALLFLELTRISSPSGQEREVNDFLAMRLHGLGLEVQEGEPLEDTPQSAGNLYCRMEGNAPGFPILFAAHTDTVASEPGSLPSPILENGVFRSQSRSVLGADNKAAVAAIVYTVEKIIRENISHAGLEVLLTVGEESGLRGAKASLLDGIAARCGFCFDSTGPVGGIVLRSPSQKTIRAAFTGRSAHAGVAPEEGRNAVAAAARAVAAMKLGRIDAETTANIGMFQGGEAVNVVPGRCSIAGEARSHNPQKLEEQITAMLDAIAFAAAAENVDVETTVVDEFHAFDLSAGNLPVDLADQSLRSLGIEPSHTSTGGGSDVNVFNLKGLPCVNLSVGMEKVHTSDEYVSLESLYQVHEAMLALLRQALE